jgi:hypothetical protein
LNIQIPPFSRKWQILPGKYMQVLSISHKMADYFASGKKDISKKDIFYLHGIYSIQTSVLISSCNFDVEKYSLCVYVRVTIST